MASVLLCKSTLQKCVLGAIMLVTEVAVLTYEICDNRFLGKRIFLARKLSGMTLRELSRITGLSHSYISRIEKGAVRPGIKSLRPIMDALDLPVYSDGEIAQEFQALYQTLYTKVLFVDYTGARALYAKLKSRKSRYANSGCFVDYYLVMLMTSLHTNAPKDEIEDFYRAAQLLYDVMTPRQQELFNVEKALYLSRIKSKQEAFEHLLKCLPRVEDPHLRGIAYYSLGCYISGDHTRFTEASEYLRKAQEIFEEHANFQRSNRAKAVRQQTFIHMHRFELFEESYQETLAYAKQYGILDLYYFTKMNLARYYIVVEDYNAVIETLDSFTGQETWYYVMKLYAYYILNRYDEGREVLAQYDRENPITWRPIEEQFIAVLEYLITKGRDDYALKRMKELVDNALKRHDFLVISMTVSLYGSMLKDLRRYREAFEYGKKWLDVLKTVR